jgi:hypothetical protein
MAIVNHLICILVQLVPFLLGLVLIFPGLICSLFCLDCSGVVEHILPDTQNGNISNGSPHHVASSLFPPASTIELPPYNSCLPQSSKFFHSLSITSIFNRLHRVLNVGKKITNYTV